MMINAIVDTNSEYHTITESVVSVIKCSSVLDVINRSVRALLSFLKRRRFFKRLRQNIYATTILRPSPNPNPSPSANAVLLLLDV